MLRPERLTATTEPRSDGRSIDGTVSDVVFQGATARIVVRLADDSEVIAQRRDGNGHPVPASRQHRASRVGAGQRVPALRLAPAARCHRQRHRHPRGARRLLGRANQRNRFPTHPTDTQPTGEADTDRTDMTTRRPTPFNAPRRGLTRRQLLARAGALGAAGISLPATPRGVWRQ